MNDRLGRRPIVAQPKPEARLAILLGGLLSMAVMSAVLAGFAWLGLVVAGETSVLSFRQLLGFAVILVSVRVVDLAIGSVRGERREAR